MKPAIALACLALAGCATQSMEQAVAAASNIDLCEAVYYAPRELSVMSSQEQARRGIACTDYTQAIETRRMQRAAVAAQPRPVQQFQWQPQTLAPIQTQRQTVCNTVRIGNQLQTVCN